MAVEINTATDYKDLLARLQTFLNGLSGGEDWTTMRYNTPGGTGSDELILRAPGLAAADQIYCGISTFENATADYFNWRVAGFTGYNGALAFGAQPGVMQNVFMQLWNSPIPYWFIGNGRRVIMVAKISTSYMMMYMGFIHTYHSPNQYPYPLAIGGNWAFSPEPSLADVAWRWSNPFFTNTNFPMSTQWQPGGGADPLASSTLRMRAPNGVWKQFNAGQNGQYQDADDSKIWPYMAGMVNLQQNLGPTAQSPLFPIILHDNTPEVYGELDGVFATSGQAIASEDIIQEGGDDYLVVQNVFRTARNTYCAVKLV